MKDDSGLLLLLLLLGVGAYFLFSQQQQNNALNAAALQTSNNVGLAGGLLTAPAVVTQYNAIPTVATYGIPITAEPTYPYYYSNVYAYTNGEGGVPASGDAISGILSDLGI